MLKDISDSDRLIKKFRELKNDKAKKLEMIIISKEYWKVEDSVVESEEVTVEFKEVYEKFYKHFTTHRDGRELKMLPNYGRVDLTLSFDNGDFKFSVKPI